MPRAVATLGVGKVNDGAGLLLHKRKDGGAQWQRYTIHERCREMSLGATLLLLFSLSSLL
ncbi:DUF4102 domain-containing protein [Bartonella sp. MM73XJBT]|uniref:DUF4102 domain-containing protein n=1 Tax=Bartonella sp. MM73XJBT TaxID=3019095 RepID=UPI00236040FE|nr:DUF4102 domain-containing protein [Bartonella sp. MM73XJBT]